MKHCPVCGSVKIQAKEEGGDMCLRDGCGHSSPKAFPNFEQGTVQCGGVAIGPGNYWVRPHQRCA